MRGDLESRLAERGAELGISLIGIARADASNHGAFYRSWLAAGQHGEMGYLARPDAVARREDPSRTMATVRSMMRTLFAAALVAGLGGAVAAADLKSGPQAGEKVPGPFHPLNVNGEDAGKKACLYCKHGDSPVAMVFARTANEARSRCGPGYPVVSGPPA